MRAAALVLTILAGCLKDPTPDDDGGDDPDSDTTDTTDDDGTDGPVGPVSGTEDSDALSIQAADGFYRMTFMHKGMPTSMMIDGTEMLAVVPHECPREQGTGVALYPWDAVDSVRRSGTMAELTFAGPVVAGVEHRWAQPIECDDDSVTAFSGKTRFTIFPDGRIHRFDEANIGQPGPTPQTMMGTCDQCGNGNEPANSVMNTYLTSFATVQADEGFEPATLSLDDPALTNDPLCVKHGGRALAFSWVSENGVDYTEVGQRRVIHAGTNAILVHDWLREEDQVSKVLSEGYQVHTTWLPGDAANCDIMLNRVGLTGPGSADLTVSVVGEGQLRHPLIGPDGMFQDRIGGPLQLQIGAITLTTSTGLPPGWAVYFDLGPQTAALAVSKDPPEMQGEWYREQRIEVTQTMHHVIVWFRDGLGPTETISLHPSTP